MAGQLPNLYESLRTAARSQDDFKGRLVSARAGAILDAFADILDLPEKLLNAELAANKPPTEPDDSGTTANLDTGNY